MTTAAGGPSPSFSSARPPSPSVGGPAGPGSTSSRRHRTPPHDPRAPARRWGARAVALAVTAAVGLGWTWAYSTTSVDPVPGLRIPLILLLPVGLVGAVLAAAYAWPAGGRARRRSVVALAGVAVVVVGFVVLLETAPGA